MNSTAELRDQMPQGEPIDVVSKTTLEPVMPSRIPCNVCQHEIPISEAMVSEATDYVAYFCGLDCYDRWHESHN